MLPCMYKHFMNQSNLFDEIIQFSKNGDFPHFEGSTGIEIEKPRGQNTPQTQLLWVKHDLADRRESTFTWFLFTQHKCTEPAKNTLFYNFEPLYWPLWFEEVKNICWGN